MKYKKISRKRFIKILMSAGYSHNKAVDRARLVCIFDSYFDLACSIAGVDNPYRRYGW